MGCVRSASRPNPTNQNKKYTGVFFIYGRTVTRRRRGYRRTKMEVEILDDTFLCTLDTSPSARVEASGESGSRIIASRRGDPRWKLEEWMQAHAHDSKAEPSSFCSTRDQRVKNERVCCAYHYQGCPPAKPRVDMPSEYYWMQHFPDAEAPLVELEECSLPHANWKAGEIEHLMQARNALVYCGDRPCFKKHKTHIECCRMHYWGCPGVPGHVKAPPVS